jgi:hypothetical protein
MAPPAAFVPGRAVDGVNWKFSGLGGSIRDRSVYGTQGAVSIPLQGYFGAQIDGTLGSYDSRFMGAIGGHLFWRNPAQGMLGLYVNHVHWDKFGGVNASQVAAEGELYWGRVTLQGVLGVEWGNTASNINQINALTGQVGNIPGVASTTTYLELYDIKTRVFDQINLKYYITDNWNIMVGHRYLGGKNALAFGTEAAFPLGRGQMASAFLEGRVGQDRFEGVWGGVRVYYGQKDKPLIARHREDDPTIWDSLFSIVNSVANSVANASQLFCTTGTLQPDLTCEAGGGCS